METLGLKNINMLTKEQFDGLENLAPDELYAVSSSGFGKPSDRYIDLTLGASGASYTAPANGWIVLAKECSNGQFIYMGVSKGIATQVWGAGGGYVQAYLPLLKGDVVNVNYTASGAVAIFRFYYDEGEI